MQKLTKYTYKTAALYGYTVKTFNLPEYQAKSEKL